AQRGDEPPQLVRIAREEDPSHAPLGDLHRDRGVAAVVIVRKQAELAIDGDFNAASGRPASPDPFEKAYDALGADDRAQRGRPLATGVRDQLGLLRQERDQLVSVAALHGGEKRLRQRITFVRLRTEPRTLGGYVAPSPMR